MEIHTQNEQIFGDITICQERNPFALQKIKGDLVVLITGIFLKYQRGMSCHRILVVRQFAEV
jgi:hypothetical protein